MNEDRLATFWEHAEALRQTLLRAAALIFCGFLLSFLFYKPLLQYLIDPVTPKGLQIEEVRQKRLLNREKETFYTLSKGEEVVGRSEKIIEVEPGCYLIPKGESLLLSYSEPVRLKILSPLEGMVSTLKIVLWTGIALSSPFWLFLILNFIAPALSRETAKLLLPFLSLSTLLFFSGLFFAKEITLPWANQFLTAFNKDIGENLWGFAPYLDYTLTLLLSNGLAFESAAILLFLVHFGKISADQLKSKRRHAIVGIFIISAILTPPDVLTQLMLAIPLMGLYEIVIGYAAISARRRSRAGRDHQASSTIDRQSGQTLPTDL